MDSKLSQWCNGLIEAGWLVAILAIPLFFNIHSDRVFEPDKLTLLRSIVLLMSVAWLVKFIDQQGWRSLEWLRWQGDQSIWLMPLVLPVFLLVVSYLISTLFSVTPAISLAGSYQRLQGTYTTFSYIVIFALIAATMRTRVQVQRVVTVVIITTIPISFYALLQHFDLDPLPWGGNVQSRVAGHMGNAIFIAAYLIMAVPLTLSRIIDAFTNILGDEQFSAADVIRSSIYIFTLAIQLMAIFWSSSRGPWIGLAVGLFSFILIVLVSLRNAAADRRSFQLVDAGKALLLLIASVAIPFALFSLLITALTNTGRAQSLTGPMTSFASFAAALGVATITIFIMLALRRGWRWLWLSWLLLALFVASGLVIFNFAGTLATQYAGTPVVGSTLTAVDEWRSLPGIGRLGRLLEAERGTGKVRVLIWEGVLELIRPHEPLQYPDGTQDRFNFLRPLVGYGPESMYVAYNRFYPPELATVEARNASPDRSHNETFDALVITGILGFLIWQALYLSVFYYGFRWLGVVSSPRDRNLLLGLWIAGGILAAIVLTRVLGAVYLGVAIPFGSIGGLIVYLIYYALFARPGRETVTKDPFAVERLTMVGLITAVLAHYVEVHFGIAIAATRLHFFAYLGLMFITGYLLPRLKEAPAPAPVVTRGRKRARNRVAADTPATNSGWQPVLLYTLLLALMIGILGYEFITYSPPPDKIIETAADLTAADIFHQSFFLNVRKGFIDSPFIFLLVMVTWSLGVLVSLSEMVKNGEINFTAVSNHLITNRRQITGALFVLFGLLSVALRFVALPPPEAVTPLIGRSLLLMWGALCLLTAARLLLNAPHARFLAGAMSIAGLVLVLPMLVAGAVWVGLITAIICGVVLYLVWDSAWSHTLVRAGVLAFVSLSSGLLYAFIQASLLRASIFFRPLTTTDLQQLRIAEASRSGSFLVTFYLFLIALMFVAAFVLAAGEGRRTRASGSAVAYAGLAVLLVVAFIGISLANVRVVQADVAFKRAKPFDQEASRPHTPETRERAVLAWDSAIAIYEYAIELTPREDFYYLFLGRAYLERSTLAADTAEQAALFSKAEARLKRAQDINPLNTDHTANLARLNTRLAQLSQDPVEKQRRLELAESYYQAALTLSPQNSVIRNEYAGLTYELKRDCDEALALYDHSIEIDPYYSDSYFRLADVYIGCAAEQGETVKTEYYQEAAASLEQGLERDSSNLSAWLRLGQIYDEIGDYEQALATYTRARELNVTDQVPSWNIDYLMATVHQKMGNRELALSLAQQALRDAPPEAADQIQQFLSQQ